MKLHRYHSPALRFWSRVEKTSSCWLWHGTTRGGYGLIYYNHKQIGSHVFSWILHKGVIPDGTQVLHKCDVHGCVNPEHLFLGDHAANMHDKAVKGRAARRLTKDQVVTIRAMSGNFTQLSIAKQFGVDQSLISRIVRGESWGHLN